MTEAGKELPTALVNSKVFLSFGLVYFLTIGILLYAMINKIQADMRVDLNIDKLSLLNLVISVVFLTFSLSTARIQINMAFFWSFQIIFFGLNCILLQIDTNPIYLARVFSEAVSGETILLLLCVTLVSGTTQVLINVRNLNDSSQLKSSSIPVVNLKRIHGATFLYILVLPFLIYRLGGPSSVFRTVRISNGFEYNSLATKSIFESLLYVPPVILLLGLLYIPDQHRNVRDKRLIILLSLLLIILSNPFGNARQTTLFVALPIAFYLLHRARRIYSYLFFLSLPIILAFSANLVNRYSGKLQKPTLTILSRDGDFDSIIQLSNGLQATNDQQFPIFRQILGSIFFFIPRSIWQGKPFDTGVELANYLGLRFQNLSAPWILEAYVNARILGVIAAALFVGYVLTVIDLKKSQNIKQFVMVFTTSGLLFIILRGSLLQASGRAIFAYALISMMFKTQVKQS